MASLIHTIRKLTEPIATRVKMVVARAVIDAIDDSKGVQELRVRALSREVLDLVERFGPVTGITAYPPAGGEAVVVCVGGNRDHPICVATDDRRYRPSGELSEGDVMLYHPTAGSSVHLKADGSVAIVAPGGLTVEGDVTVTGDLDASGDVSAAGDVQDAVRAMAADRAIYNGHTHKENGAGGGITDPTLATQ